MIKTFNINLAGQIFNINEDAYEHLSGYFSSLRSFYNDEEEKDEIIRDIESRFAELFLAKGKNYIITKADAIEVVNMMGNPQEFDEEKTQQSSTASTASSTSSTATFPIGKRLYRDPDNSLVAGVCSGISNYFGVADPIWVRIGFILLTIITGFGFGLLAYPILWFIMPEAVTSTQKLEMRGEAVNLSNIEKQLKDETPVAKPKGVFGQIIAFLGAGVLLFFKFLLWIGIACAVLIGGVLLFAFFIVMIVLSVLAIIGVPFVNTYFFENTSSGWFLGLGGILVGIIPIIFAIVALVHITSKKVKPLKKHVVFPLIGLFLFGLLLLNISGFNAKKLIAEKKRINQTYPLNYGYKSDTLQLMINPTIKDEDYNNVNVNGITDLMNFVSDHNEKFFPVEIEIYPSLTDSFTVVKEFSANGKTDKDAIQNATSFTHSITQINNKLIIDPYIQFENNKIKFRNQKLKVKVYVPEGKIIRWDERTEKYMDEGKLVINWDNIKDPNGIQINIPAPPAPPTPPSMHKNITIKIDSKNTNVNEELEKAKAELEKAAEELEAKQAEMEDSLDQEFHVRLQREHYIFRMQNGELIAID
ncbi:MAG: PspC domain-containing protein [Chitinophagales bacterium]